MGTVSLCMILRDEEAVLARCLAAVAPHVDQIVAVDTGSGDRTREIAASFGAEVFDFPWVDDFSAARNFAFSKGSMDYLLWLDADDVVPAETAMALRGLADGRADVVTLPYRTGFDEAGRCTFWCRRARLVRRAAGFVWTGAVHECITPRGTVLDADFPIDHRPGPKRQTDRNLRILEGLLKKNGSLSPRDRYYYGRELLDHGRAAEAKEQLRRFLEGPGWGPDRVHAARLLAAHSPGPAGTAVLLDILGTEALTPGLCCDLGARLLEADNLPAAEGWFLAAMALPEPRGFVQPEEGDFLPALWLTVCRDKTGDLPGALRWHQKCMTLRPDHPAVRHNQRYFLQKSDECGIIN